MASSRPLLGRLLAASALAVVGTLALSAGAEGELAGPLTVTVHGIPSGEGRLLIGVFDSASAFPKHELAVTGKREAAQSGSMTFTFEGLAAGTWAIAAIHDQNGNGRLDKNVVGVPTEPYGFSRDARGTFGPPSFDAAAIRLEVGAARSVSFTVK